MVGYLEVVLDVGVIASKEDGDLDAELTVVEETSFEELVEGQHLATD